MKNKILRVLSFALIAIFTVAFMGIAVSAEEVGIPAIEEVGEEDLIDEVVDVDEFVEIQDGEVTPAETDYFQVLTGETHKGYYETISEAYSAAANGDTIKLLKDWSYNNVNTLSGKSVTIDGNNHTMTDTFKRTGEHDFASSFRVENATVTFKNINITATATNLNEAHTQGFLTINANGHVIFGAGTKIYNYFGTNGVAAFVNDKTAVLEVLDGVEISNCSHKNTQGVIATYKGTVYIKGGTFKNNAALVVGGTQSEGKCYISGGTFTGNAANDVMPSGGKFEISGTASIQKLVCESGSVIIKDGFAGTAGITGTKYYTKITLENPESISKLTHTNTFALTTVAKAEGGYDLVWDCEATIDNETCYATLEEAISACSAGKTIYIKKDVTKWREKQCNEGGEDHINITNGRVVTIEGEGHTLSTSRASTGGSHRFFVVYQGSKLTVRNLTLDGKGVFGFITVHYAATTAGTVATFENCTFVNSRGNNDIQAYGGTLNLIKCNIQGAKTGATIQLAPNATASNRVNQELQYNILGCTIDGAKGNYTINVAGYGANLTIDSAPDGTKTTIKNCVGDLGTAIRVIAGSGTVNINNLVVENCKSANEAAAGLYTESPVTITNSVFKNNTSLKGGGALYFTAGAAGSTVTNCTFDGNTTDTTDKAGGAIYMNGAVTVTGCTFNNNSAANGGAIFVSAGKTLNLRGENTITGNTARAEGGAIYLQGTSELNVSGKLNISGNTKVAGDINNIFLENSAMVYVDGAVDSESVISLRRVLSAGTVAIANDTSYVDPKVFVADGTPTGITLKGVYFPETIGDGRISEDGDPVIDMGEIDNRGNGRENEIVIHWPWMVVRANGDAYGYYSLKAAYDHRNDGVIYAQKDMTIPYQWNKEINNESTSADFSALLAVTEFPLWTVNQTSGVFTDLNHTDLANVEMFIDGNGHVIDAAKSSNSVFVIYGNTTNLRVDNFIYVAGGNKAFVSLADAGINNNVTGGFTANNSYLSNGNANVASGHKNGTITLNNSTVDGKIIIGKGANLALNSTKVKNSNGTAIVTSTTSSGEVPTIYVNGNTFVNDPEAGNFNVMKDAAKIVIGADFTGEIHLDDYANQLVAGDGFEAFESVTSVVKDGTNGKTFAYYDAETGTFGWANLPELTHMTDAGVYSAGAEKPGIIRFVTTFDEVTADSVASYGVYALGTNSFDGTMDEGINGFASFDVTPGAGRSYFVDAINIGEENYNTPVYALSFVKFKGINNPYFKSFGTTSVTNTTVSGAEYKDLGAKA